MTSPSRSPPTSFHSERRSSRGKDSSRLATSAACRGSAKHVAQSRRQIEAVQGRSRADLRGVSQRVQSWLGDLHPCRSKPRFDPRIVRCDAGKTERTSSAGRRLTMGHSNEGVKRTQSDAGHGTPGPGGGGEIGKVGVTMGDTICKGYNQRRATTCPDQCLERNSRSLYGADENRLHC